MLSFDRCRVSVNYFVLFNEFQTTFLLANHPERKTWNFKNLTLIGMQRNCSNFWAFTLSQHFKNLAFVAGSQKKVEKWVTKEVFIPALLKRAVQVAQRMVRGV